MIASTVEIHPLALRVPGMTAAEFDALREDIATNGLAQAITMFEGKVLDGRHRLAACEQVGVEPRFEEYDGDSPATFVLSLNGKRRHLSAGQLAMLATDFLPDLEAERRPRPNFQTADRDALGHVKPSGAPTGAPLGRASEHAADLVGVSSRSVQRAKRVQEADPDLAEQVRQGEVTINAASEQIAERKKTEPTRDSSRKRPPAEIVERVISKALATVAALDHFNWREAIHTEAPLAQWDKDLTDTIVPLYQLRGDIRKVLSDG